MNIIIRDFWDMYVADMKKILSLNIERGHIKPDFFGRFQRILDFRIQPKTGTNSTVIGVKGFEGAKPLPGHVFKSE